MRPAPCPGADRAAPWGPPSAPAAFTFVLAEPPRPTAGRVEPDSCGALLVVQGPEALATPVLRLELVRTAPDGQPLVLSVGAAEANAAPGEYRLTDPLPPAEGAAWEVYALDPLGRRAKPPALG